MSEDEKEAYEAGRAACEQLHELHPDAIPGEFGGQPITAELGHTLRMGVENIFTMNRIGLDTPIPPDFAESQREMFNLYHRLKERIQLLPDGVDPDTDPQANALEAALEEASERAQKLGIEKAVSIGAPVDDILPDAQKPEDEYWARGFIDKHNEIRKPH